MPKFEPKAYDVIRLFGDKYGVQPHPGGDGEVPYSASGRRAVVYQLKSGGGDFFALKIFAPKYRLPSLVDSSEHLKQLENFEGLKAARRRIILPSDPATTEYSNLKYAMLMPWIKGRTWHDILHRKEAWDRSKAIVVCEKFLDIMQNLEINGVAHTDVASGNVVVDDQTLDVQLLDLEDFYVPKAKRPDTHNLGTKGYNHHSGESLWRPEGDRYATAVLAAEMLLLTEPALASKAAGEGFFPNHPRAPEARERFVEARNWLRNVAGDFASVFERSCSAETLNACPPIAELHKAIKTITNMPSAYVRQKPNSEIGRTITSTRRPAPGQTGKSNWIEWEQDEPPVAWEFGQREPDYQSVGASQTTVDPPDSSESQQASAPAPEAKLSSGLGCLVLIILIALVILWLSQRP